MLPLNIRRATLDDLPALRSLWDSAGLPADELENRLTEFQVVEAQGAIAGAMGVQVVRQHVRFHSEDYVDFSIADAARELFWERIQKLAANLGVFRVWTQEASPFWTHWGFHPARAEQLARLPDEWKHLGDRWLTLELKNEDAINEAMKQRLAGLVNSEQQQTARLAAQAKNLRLFFTIVFFAIGIIGIALAAYLLIHRRSQFP